MKRSAVALALLAALTLTGCAQATEQPASEPRSLAATAENETPAPVETEEPAPEVDITAPGEVCDPNNMNDAICAAFYPDQAVLNITSRSADLAGVSDAEKIERARSACTGSEPIDSALYKAGAIAYCNEYAPGTDEMPDRYSRIIAFYQSIGEDASKTHYADRVMPTPAELGY